VVVAGLAGKLGVERLTQRAEIDSGGRSPGEVDEGSQAVAYLRS